jgi:uncharacterized protein YneF (UPF0154 family)
LLSQKKRALLVCVEVFFFLIGFLLFKKLSAENFLKSPPIRKKKCEVVFRRGHVGAEPPHPPAGGARRPQAAE